jgi:2-iminobutanoate/2-iminopropanoate deaminase
MKKKIVNAHNAPAPIGPYNHANAANGFLFISGQVALNPVTGEMMQNSIQEETRQVLTNLKAIVEVAGGSLLDIVKCSVFVTDMEQYAAINAVYAEFFADDTAPARELVQVSRLPRNANVEISAIAVLS